MQEVCHDILRFVRFVVDMSGLQLMCEVFRPGCSQYFPVWQFQDEWWASTVEYIYTSLWIKSRVANLPSIVWQCCDWPLGVHGPLVRYDGRATFCW